MKPSTDSTEYQTAISVQKMRESDAYTIANLVSSRELMFRAASGVYQSAQWDGKKIAIMAGGGNNGGDGYALAGILADHGVTPQVFQASEKRSDDGQYYYALALEKGVPIRPFLEGQSLDRYDVVVDCLLGTGFAGTPRGLIADAIRAVNRSSARVISVDINSGLNGDTGEAELAVRSDLTVSIGYYKTGLFLGEAPRLIGELINVDIGIVLAP